MRREKVVVRENLRDVCGEDANDEQPRNQCGLLASEMEIQVVTLTDAESHSMLSTRARSSLVCCRAGKERRQQKVQNWRGEIGEMASHVR